MLETKHHRERFLSSLCGGMDTLRSYGGSWLSAMDVDTGKIWQTNERGDSRVMQLADL